MARKSGGYRVYPRGQWAWISTRIAGEQVREALGIEYSRTREVGELAEKRYQELIAGRLTRPEGRIATGLTVEELVAEWLVVREEERPRSKTMHNDHARVFRRLFTSVLDLFADDARERYTLRRAKEATRKTIRKELSSLSRLYEWAYREGHITSVPPPYAIPLHIKGTRTGPQREKPVDVTPEEAAEFLAALPEKARGGFPLRDFFTLLWETGLRESTIARLSVPTHWQPGWKHLHITWDIDKASYERDVPITPKAVAILKKHAPKEGLVFGDHDWRKRVKAARDAVLDATRAKAFATRDIRHARTTDLANSGAAITGVQHLVGHLQLSTTSQYVHTRKQMAAEALRMSTRQVQRPKRRKRKA